MLKLVKLSAIINSFKLLRRITIHKYWVAKYCFELGLYWRGITHDLSKFSWTEFSRAVKYWHSSISSLANERNINGYSYTFLHHRGRNPHHYEYWVHHLDGGGIAAKMPRKYTLELICDYLAACRTYGGDIKTEYDWFKTQNLKMHLGTRNYVEAVFWGIKNGLNLKDSVIRADKIINYQ